MRRGLYGILLGGLALIDSLHYSPASPRPMEKSVPKKDFLYPEKDDLGEPYQNAAEENGLRKLPEYNAAMRAIQGHRPQYDLADLSAESLVPILKSREEVEWEIRNLTVQRDRLSFAHIEPTDQTEYDDLGRKIQAYQLALQDGDAETTRRQNPFI